MLLYKFVPTREIAQQVSRGVYRFYELIKYIKLEERSGRSDPLEGAIGFTDDEIKNSPERLPIGSFNGVDFHCTRISPDDEYLKQYFVFCMSTVSSTSAIDGCNYMVELDTNIFDVFETLLPTPKLTDADGTKFFSHAPVEYYDIQNHPAPINGEAWKEAYLKHSDFSRQREYRAAMFVSDHFFHRVGNQPAIYKKAIGDRHGNPFDFDLKLLIRSGVDEIGWRYLELDVSEFQANILPEPCEILTLTS